MSKKNKVHQINIKVDDEDLATIDFKCKKYGMTRSAMIKLFTLNGELTINMQEQLRKPKL